MEFFGFILVIVGAFLILFGGGCAVMIGGYGGGPIAGVFILIALLGVAMMVWGVNMLKGPKGRN
jgi:hypothetical protein